LRPDRGPRGRAAPACGPAGPARRDSTSGGSAAGQGLIEYGLILGIMAIVCIISLVFFGDQLSSLLSLIASAV
jgi:Flp pilus assembly pilin Flp